jgi:hypothetical protein
MGLKKEVFFISGQYRDEEGIMIGNRLQRYSARANIDFSPTSKIRAGAKVSFSYLNFTAAQLGIGGNGGNIGRQNFGATGGWGQVNSGALTIMPVYNEDGTYFDPLRGRNIAAGTDPNNYSSRTNQNRTLGTVFLEYTLLPGLSLHGEGSVDFINNNAIYWVSDIIRYNRIGQEEGRFVSNRNFNGYASYNRKIGDGHEINLTTGAETQKTVTRRQDYAFEGLQGSQQEIGEIGNGTNQFITAVSGIFGDSYFISYFGRANYKFMDKYLLGLSFRRDGSTAFGPNNRFGNFPAVSLGWIVSDEDFFTPLSHVFDFVKLRASYGRTGNANIRSFAFLNNYVNWPVYGTAPAFGFSVLANPNIGWELNDQADGALEFAMFQGRLQGSVGYYNKLSRNMLLNVPVAPNVGIGAGGSVIITNIGDLKNSGVELELNSLNLELGGFKWSTALNFTTNHNKIIRLTPQFEILPSGSNPVATGIQQGVSITQVGGRLSTYYLAEYAGIDEEGFETIYEIDKDILRQTGQTVKTGNAIRATQANINANRIVNEDKSGLPTWFGGITNTFSFKGIELSALFTFQGGNYIYDALEENNSYVRAGSNVILAGVYGNTWTEDNPNAKYPKLTWNMRDTYDDPATVAEQIHRP